MGGLLKQYMWVANLVVILFCSYFVAKIFNVYIGKTMEVRQTIGVMKKTEKIAPVRESRLRSDYTIITERNIFDSSEAPPAEAVGETSGEDSAVVEGKEAVKTGLPLTLYAVLVVGEGKDKRSSATVSMEKKEPDVYEVRGDKSFSPGVILVQVKPDRIEFMNKGRLEYAKLEEEGVGSIFGPPEDKAKVAEKDAKAGPETAVKTAQDGKILLDQRELEGALSNLDQLYTEIRAVPNFQDGKVNGMKVLSIKPGSVFAKLGIQRGDILSRINGIELDVRRGFDIFNQLKDQKSFNLDLVRGGASQTVEYEIR